MARHRTSKKAESIEEPTPPVLGEAEQAAERRSRPARERQHPALYGEPETEVAERTADHDTEPTDTYTKDFVAPRAAWGETGDHEAQHAANINAVRQSMLANGLRADGDVSFEGEHDHPFDKASVVLRYTVAAVPAATTETFDQRHMVVVQDGPSPTERAEHDAARVERLRAGHDARREGTEEGDRSTGEARIADVKAARGETETAPEAK